MTKPELWRALVDRHPVFVTGPSIPFTPAGLRKFFELVWAQAQKDARGDLPQPEGNPFSDLFGGGLRG